MKQYILEIYFLFGRDKKKLTWLILLFLFSAVLDLISIGLIGPYIALFTNSELFDPVYQYIPQLNALLSNDRNLLLLIVGTLLVMVFFIKALISIWINYKIISFSQEQEVSLRSSLMRAYQSLPYAQYISRNSAEYIDISHRLVDEYCKGVLIPSLQMICSAIVVMAIIGFLMLINGVALFLLIAIFGVLILIYDLYIRKRQYHHGKQSNIEAKNMIQGITEGVSGLKEIRILGVEEYFYQKVYNGAKRFANHQRISSMFSVIPRFFLEFILILFLVSFVTILVLLNTEENINDLLPAISILGVAALRLLPATNNVSTMLTKLRYHRDSVSLLYKNISEFNNIKKILVKNIANLNVVTDKSFESLSINNISFKYPESTDNSLSNINLSIKKGESIGLIGTSGSGKTTLIDVLLGLLEPSDGKIFYNNKIINSCMGEWRSQVAYIPQEIFIIDDTLRRNIAFGIRDEYIDETLLNSAIKQAQLTDLVDQMKVGLDTVLGDQGVRLSGGQRQRVALSRAFYHNRNILIMDEATSELDNDTEKEIINEIQYLKGIKTVIVIAHRLTTVQYCDCIYRLEGGKIVDSGTPDTML